VEKGAVFNQIWIAGEMGEWVLKNSVFAANGQIFGDGKCLAIREDRL